MIIIITLGDLYMVTMNGVQVFCKISIYKLQSWTKYFEQSQFLDEIEFLPPSFPPPTVQC